MGDIADNDIEQNEDMLFAHLHRDCLQDCIYCDEEALDEMQYKK